MADPIRNPLPEPKKRPHTQMEFDIVDIEDDLLKKVLEENTGIYRDAEDTFDFRISDDDDFDI